MISIIIPAYIDTIEKLEWLNEAINSVKSQTFQDWEIILVDDCSSQTISIDNDKIRKFRLTDKSGPALARNTGVALASYDAILPLDADDQLASENVLQLMYSLWEQDTSRVIYGDIQRLQKTENIWRLDKIITLPEYTFELSLKLSGIMPVTALHSKECHIKAGGWKKEIEFGLEDVEYWIAAGKAGFCGRRLDEITLLYRRHEKSRSYSLRMVNRQETAMRNAVRLMHQDVYEGRYPMGCCGGGRSYTPPKSVNTSQAMITTLDQFRPDEKIWVQYNGRRNASFGMVGKFTNVRYTVDGAGHKLEVHVNDLPLFRRSGRGADFAVGVVAPDNGTEPKQTVIEDIIFQAQDVEVAQVERLDKRALAEK
jgi:GT2 family glycosyltransferase